MNQQHHLMIDVETLGVNPLAPIMQIGAILFDSYTGEHKCEYLANIMQSEGAIAHYGLKSDQATIEWWAGQPTEIWEACHVNARPLEDVMAEFTQGMASIGVTKETPIWSHATFDFPLVNHHLKLANQPPLYYRASKQKNGFILDEINRMSPENIRTTSALAQRMTYLRGKGLIE